jgi:hypothetical protein
LIGTRQGQAGYQVIVEPGRVDFAVFRALGIPNDFQQLHFISFVADQPTVKNFARWASRTRVHHLHDVGERRVFTDACVQERQIGSGVQPHLDQTFWTGTQRFAADSAGMNDLYEVAQHFGESMARAKTSDRSFGARTLRIAQSAR